MIARVTSICRLPRKSLSGWQAGFLAMLPSIQTYARRAFMHFHPEARQDLVQEVIANALLAYVRLYRQGRVGLAYPTVLARYGIAQTREGRRVGNRLRIGDVLSTYCQRKKGVVVERLDQFDPNAGEWREAVIKDRRTPPPEQAAFRIDFPAWLRQLSKRDRRIAQRLAANVGTDEVAQQFGLSAGRVSQLRRELHASWHTFHGEVLPARHVASSSA